MAYLLITTIVWAFSFSLIGVYLAGQVDPWFSVLMRISLAMFVFLPFIKINNIDKKSIFQLMAIGMVQLGLMYGFYYHSFLYLSVPEVLLFTIFTPLYITLLNDILDGSFNFIFFVSASIAVIGALTIRLDNITSNFVFGLLLVQGANFCFAVGQVTYKRLMQKNKDVSQSHVFGWFFIGAFVVALISFLLFGDMTKLPSTSLQWGVLAYLGIVASSLGYFAWNKGATMVDIGTLAVMNNLLIPMGIAVNVLFWNKEADIYRLFIGAGIIILALLLNKRLSNKFNKLIKG